jgi:hypothetical protein
MTVSLVKNKLDFQTLVRVQRYRFIKQISQMAVENERDVSGRTIGGLIGGAHNSVVAS